MPRNPDTNETADTRGLTRRRFLGVAAAGALAGKLGACSPGADTHTGGPVVGTLRWGVVGTGSIANSMAGMIKLAANSALAAVSSRQMATARQYADTHEVAYAFDSWADMIASDTVDAIYVATPTSVREDICVAAARGGKHVLGEKPFASLSSVRRIVTACRENDVAFMDGTHFVHHPRTLHIKAHRDELVGAVSSVESAFEFNLQDRSNIRFNTELEPMGAIGDAGWYNMRAAVEYLPPDVELEGVSAFLRRDEGTGAAIGGSGELLFTGGLKSTWRCGFDAAAVVMHLRIAGAVGQISIDDFLYHNPDGSADFELRRGTSQAETIHVASTQPGAALMFEDMAKAAVDPAVRSQWMTATERTQALLDAVWQAALGNEASG